MVSKYLDEPMSSPSEKKKRKKEKFSSKIEFWVEWIMSFLGDAA
jgi:hypothetical protein